MESKKLEEVIEKRIEPVIDEAMKKYLGIRVSEIKSDISDKILHSPLLGLKIEFNLDFKSAKKRFKESFIEKMMHLHYGNVSEVARITGVNRRSIHRMVSKTTSNKIRKDLLKPYYLKQKEVEDIIESVLENYKGVINKTKFDIIYNASSEISKNVVDEIPTEEISLKQAEEEFEKKYLLHNLRNNRDDVRLTSEKVEIRYETLLRKLKKYDITFNPVF